MYQIAYVLSSKIYSENFSRPTHYNTATKASELQSKRNRGLHSPGIGRQSIIHVLVTGLVPKYIKYRSTKITEKLFTITEISRR